MRTLTVALRSQLVHCARPLMLVEVFVLAFCDSQKAPFAAAVLVSLIDVGCMAADLATISPIPVV